MSLRVRRECAVGGKPQVLRLGASNTILWLWVFLTSIRKINTLYFYADVETYALQYEMAVSGGGRRQNKCRLCARLLKLTHHTPHAIQVACRSDPGFTISEKNEQIHPGYRGAEMQLFLSRKGPDKLILDDGVSHLGGRGPGTQAAG